MLLVEGEGAFLSGVDLLGSFWWERLGLSYIQWHECKMYYALVGIQHLEKRF